MDIERTATPILDCERGLPTAPPPSAAAGATWAFVVVSVTMFFSALPFDGGDVVATAFFMAVAWPIRMVVHEGGHLIAGWCAGFTFDAVTFSRLTIVREGRGVAARWDHPDHTFTSTAMRLPNVAPADTRHLVFAAGGFVASTVCAIVAGWTVSHADGDLRGFSVCIAIVAATDVALNALDLRSGPARPISDGVFIVDQLSRNARQRRRAATARVYATEAAGEPPTGIERLLADARGPVDRTADAMRGHLAAAGYLGAHDLDRSADLEAALASSVGATSSERRHLFACVMFYHAFERRDAPRFWRWRDRLGIVLDDGAVRLLAEIAEAYVARDDVLLATRVTAHRARLDELDVESGYRARLDAFLADLLAGAGSTADSRTLGAVS